MHATLPVRLVGVAPVLMHNGRGSDPLDPMAKQVARLTRKRSKTEADYEQIARIEWHMSLWTDGGRPCLPGEAVEAALVQAARTKRLGRAAAAGLLCPGNPLLEYAGPTTIDELWADDRFRLRVSVQVQRRRTMRTRPIFPEWSVTVELQFLPTLFDEAQVLELLRIAGDQIGVGDWRPRFGRFRVEPLGDSSSRQGTAGPGKASLGLVRSGWDGRGASPSHSTATAMGGVRWTCIRSGSVTAGGVPRAGLLYPTVLSGRS